MPAHKPPPDDLLALAAELRAGGAAWDAVAAKVGRAMNTVRQWPTAYPARWKKALHAAEQQQLADATAESVHTLRRQLRSADEKSSRDAATKLIQFRVALGKRARPKRATTTDTGTADAHTIAAFVAGLADAEIDRLIADLTGHGPARPPES